MAIHPEVLSRSAPLEVVVGEPELVISLHCTLTGVPYLDEEPAVIALSSVVAALPSACTAVVVPRAAGTVLVTFLPTLVTVRTATALLIEVGTDLVNRRVVTDTVTTAVSVHAEPV